MQNLNQRRLHVGALVLYSAPTKFGQPMPDTFEPVVVYAIGPGARVTVQHGDMTLRDVDAERLLVGAEATDHDLAMQARVVASMIRARRLTL